jgi:hypothetical protein
VSAESDRWEHLGELLAAWEQLEDYEKAVNEDLTGETFKRLVHKDSLFGAIVYVGMQIERARVAGIPDPFASFAPEPRVISIATMLDMIDPPVIT